MLYQRKINREVTNEDSNKRILSAYDQILEKNSTEAALGTLNAIIGILDGAEGKNKRVLDMAKGIKKSYDKNKGFSPDQAKWIYNMSKALFKK